MRIELIDVGTPRDELNEPLGIEILAGTLRDRFGSSVRVHMEYLQLSNGVLCNLEPLMNSHLIGISAGLYSSERVRGILDATRSIKYAKNQKPVIVLGNLLGTFAYKEMLNSYRDIICVRGEGEDAVCGIVQNLMDSPLGKVDEIKDSLCKADVPNLALVKEDKIVETNRKLVNLESDPKPTRDFLPIIIEKKGIVLMEGSRGCPWGLCKFCAICAKYGDAKWRPFPANRLVDELVELSNKGVNSPYFTDEDFVGSDPERILDIADRIITAKRQGIIRPGLNLYVNMPIGAIVGDRKADSRSCIAVLKKLKQAGLREVFVGIESGAKNQIGRFRKRATVERNMSALKILRDLNLTIDVGFIMFDPEMRLGDLKENVEFIRMAALVEHDARYIKKVRVEPGTELERELRAKGIIETRLDVNSLTYPYNFTDPLVQRIFETFERWEKETLDTAYTIQGRSRGEVSAERNRIKLKKFLGKFRIIDFEFLEECIRVIEKSSKDSDSVHRLRKIYGKKRSRLIRKVPKYLKLEPKSL